MSIDAKKDKMEFEYNRVIAQSQVVVECDIDTVTKGGLSKLLCVTGDVICTRIDYFVGEAKIYGRVNYKILYLNSDNNIVGVEYCSDFAESVGNSEITPNSKCMANLSLQDIDSMAKGDNIRIQAVVDIDLVGDSKQCLDVVTCVDNAIVKTKDVKTSIHIGYIDEKFEVRDDYQVGSNVEKILLFETTAEIQNIKSSKDSFIVSGEANAKILYESDGKIVTKTLNIPYSEQVKCLGIDETSMITANIQVSDSKIILAGVEDNNVITAQMTLNIVGSGFEYVNKCVVDDVFSNEYMLDVTKENVSFEMITDYKSVVERISGETSIDESVTPIKKVVAVVSTPQNMCNVKLEESEVVVDVLVNASLVYLSQDDKYNTMQVELPSSIVVPLEKTANKVNASITIKNITAKVKRERDIDIQVEFALSLECVDLIEENLILDVQAGEERKNDHSIITIYAVSPKETLWDIAKGVGASIDEIKRFNPNVNFDELKGDERVIVFRGAK